MKKFRDRATAVSITDVEYRDFIQGTGGGAGINATLLPASPRRGDLVCLKKVDAGAGALTILPEGASTIDGAASLVLPLQWDTAILLSDGTNWFTVAGIGGAVAGVSLQGAYDVGNAIITSTASGGPVALSKGAATAAGESVLTVVDASAIVSTAALVAVTNSGSRTTGDLLSVTNSNAAFVGSAGLFALSGNSVLQNGLTVSDAGAGANTQGLVAVLNLNDVRTSGDLVVITNAGDAFTGACLNAEILITSASTGAQLAVLADNGTGINTQPMVHLLGTNDVRTAAALRIGLTGAALLGNIFEMAGGDNAGLSAANEGRIIYNVASQEFQASANGGAYVSFGGGTLQLSYNAGASIVTSDAQGDIAFSKGGTTAGDEILSITDASAVASTAAAVFVSNTGSRTSGNLVTIVNTGDAFTGIGLAAQFSGTSTSQRGFDFSDGGSGANTQPFAVISNGNPNRTSGNLLNLVNTGNAFTGDLLNLSHTGTSTGAQLAVLADNGTGVNALAAVSIGGSNPNRTGALLDITALNATAETTTTQQSITLANGQQVRIRSVTTEHTLALAATSTIANFIPAGCLFWGIEFRVTTAVTTSAATDTFDIGDGSDGDRWGAAIAGALGTTADITDYTDNTVQFFAAANDVVFDAFAAETFTAGVIRVTVHYIDLVAATS